MADNPVTVGCEMAAGQFPVDVLSTAHRKFIQGRVDMGFQSRCLWERGAERVTILLFHRNVEYGEMRSTVSCFRLECSQKRNRWRLSWIHRDDSRRLRWPGISGFSGFNCFSSHPPVDAQGDRCAEPREEHRILRQQPVGLVLEQTLFKGNGQIGGLVTLQFISFQNKQTRPDVVVQISEIPLQQHMVRRIPDPFVLKRNDLFRRTVS